MQRVIKRISNFLFIILLFIPNSAYAEEMDQYEEAYSDEAYYNSQSEEWLEDYFVGYYLEGGNLLEGSSLSQDVTELQYTISNVTFNGESISKDEIWVNYCDEDLVIRTDDQYTFDITVDNSYRVLRPASSYGEPDGNEIWIRSQNGDEPFSGTITMEPISQVIHVVLSPGMELSWTFCMNYDLKYTYVLQDSNGTIIDEGTYSEDFSAYIPVQEFDYSNSQQDFSELEDWNKGRYLVLAGEDSLETSWIEVGDKSYSFYRIVYSVPFLIEDGRTVQMYEAAPSSEPSIPQDAFGMGGEPAPIDNNNVVSDLIKVVSVTGVAVAVATAAGAASNVSGDGGSFASRLMEQLKKKEAFYELEINGNVDLPTIVCEKGKVLEIPLRIVGGEEDTWAFFGKSICEKNHKKKIKTIIPPSILGSSLITCTFAGDEIVDKDIIQIVIVATNTQNPTQVLTGNFEFEMVTNKT